MVLLFVTLTPMDCPTCGNTLSERGAFCKACGAQARCMSCKAVLEPVAAACVECGTKLGAPLENGQAVPVATPQRNKITFREDRNSRSFDADFSDVTMQAVGDVLGEYFGNRGAAPRQGTPRLFSQEMVEPAAKSLATPSNGTPAAIEVEVTTNSSDEMKNVLKFFRPNDDELELIENRLKAKTGMDFVRRLTYFFLYAHELHGHLSVSKKSIIAILKDGKVWDPNASKWLAGKKGLRDANEGDEERMQLIGPSRDEAKKVLLDALDADIKDEWNPDTKIKQKRASRKKKA
jgi:hypothetical protein